MTVTVKHSKTNAISDWTQAQLDEQISLGNFPAGTTLANIVLPSDWNNDHTLTGVGTMAEQNANSVAITGGSVNGTTIGATTASTGKFTSVTTPSVTATTDNLTLSAVGAGSVYVNQGTNSATGLVLSNSAISTASARLFFQNSNGTTSISNLGGNTIEFKTNASIGTTSGVDQFRVSHTASSVNYVQVTGAATGAGPTISAQGSDTNAFLAITSKGTSAIRLQTGGSNQVLINNTTSAINQLGLTGSTAGLACSTITQGTDTNISMAFQPKGTGAIDLAAGSSGVNISNGGTVTAITRTAPGSNYTSIPTTTIAPPTTAGGVQAVAYSVIQNSAATIANGGTGYTVGDTLTMVGGTLQTGTAGTFTVSSVSAGVVTAVTVLNFGQYSAIPTNPVSVTGGTGTGCTLTVSYIYGYAVFTNNGSGYIEQPTVTITGGGGSGASAYATVGSVPIIRSLAGSGASTSSLSFYTPAGESVRINDQGITSSGYVQLQGASATSGGSYVTSSYQSLYLSATGGQQIGFFTNGQGQTRQFNISHTASAVNYVQVTGAATGSGPIISTQGSDTNATLTLRSKGTFAVTMQSSAGANIFEAIPTASSVNYLRVAPSIASSAPTLSAQGTDTNIDLALTPKGTGVVRFGTYTANMALTVQGYIEIKDSGGTLRKLAVIA